MYMCACMSVSVSVSVCLCVYHPQYHQTLHPTILLTPPPPPPQHDLFRRMQRLIVGRVGILGTERW